MHTQPLHLLPFKCTMFPRSRCDSGDCICGLPALGPLPLAFTLAQSLMWSDQTLIQIPSSASGYIESQASVWPEDVKLKKSAVDSLMILAYVCEVSASNNSDCNMIVKALSMCLRAHILNHSQNQWMVWLMMTGRSKCCLRRRIPLCLLPGIINFYPFLVLKFKGLPIKLF